MNIKNMTAINRRQIYFLSFADKRLRKSLRRIKWQAKEIAVFDKIYCWDERNLDRDFWKKWKHKIPFDGRDYRSSGCMIWKPQIIMQVLEKMQEGDILCYTDVGCHIHKYGKKRMLEYFDICDNSDIGVLCFKQQSLERKYAKGDIFDYFGCRNNIEITNTGQMAAGIIFFRKCKRSVEFVEKWRKVFLDSFELYDIDTFVSPNFDDFVANRPEQAPFSILAKLNNAAIIDFKELSSFPITAVRDKEYCKPPVWRRTLGKIKRILAKFSICVISATLYISEMIVSIFDRRIRVRFTNFWVGFHKSKYQDWWIKVIEHKCSFAKSDKKYSFRIVKRYNPQIEFFSVFGDKRKLDNSKTHIKIFYTGENVNETSISFAFKQYQGNCIDSVDLSLGFNYIEADNYIRLPNWVRWCFLPDFSKDEIKNILNNSKKQYQKIKFCALIARHDTSGLRTKIYNDVSKIAGVDCPGKLLQNDDTLHSKYKDDKRMYLQHYKFNICPENSIGEGYCTEKLFDCLLSGCIPIYNGWSKNPEPDIINPNIILWYDELDLENNKYILDEIKKLHGDDKLYRSFIEQPFFCDTAVDKIYDNLSRVKEQIHEILIIKKII
jgi:hypothetical protein